MPDRVPNLFAYAALPRFGLGNVLIPWARSEVFAARHGAQLLAPQWVRPKIGPLLRRERDLRLYWGFFSNSGTLRGPAKWRVLTHARRYQGIDAEKALSDHASDPSTPRLVVFRFQGGGPFFGADAPYARPIIQERLQAILSRRSRAEFDRARASLPKRFIAVHVRRGDKVIMPEGVSANIGQKDLWVMRSEWYERTLQSVRGAIGDNVPAVIFSDGTDEQIADLLSLPATVRSPKGSAIVDMLLLASGNVLIGTGRSSFSYWAGLLGNAPSVWYPGMSKQLYPERPEFAIETDAEGEIDPAQAEILRLEWNDSNG